MDLNVSNVSSINITTPITNARTNAYIVVPVEVVLLIRQICYIGLCPFLVIIGLVLNSICLAMFCKLQTKTSTVIMLFALAVSDIIILLAGSMNSLLQASAMYGKPLSRTQRTLTIPYYSAFVNSLPGKIGNLLTLLIATERLFCVLKPMQIRLYSTKRNACIAVILVYIVPIIISLPNAFLYRTKNIYSNTTGKKTILTLTTYGRNKDLTNLVYVTTEIILRYIPVIGVTIASAITAFTVVITAKRRSKLAEGSTKSRSTSQENQVTKMLLVVTIIFVVCNIPATILRMVIFIDPEMTPFSYKNNVYDAAFPITYVIYLVCSVVNLVIYYNTSSTYRTKLREMFGMTFEISHSREVSTVSSNFKSS